MKILTGKTAVSETSRNLMNRLTQCRQAINARKESDANTKLYVSGNVHYMYVKPTDENKKFTVMENSDARFFTEVLITQSMLLDHLPSKYDRALDRVFQSLLTMDDDRRKNMFVFDSTSSLDKNEINEMAEIF